MANEVYKERFTLGPWPPRQEITWFHHPIYEAESLWWIALWTFYYLQDSLVEERRILFPESGLGYRTDIWYSGAEYDQICTRPPETIQDILYAWLSSIRKAHTDLQARFEDASYQSFDYYEVMEASFNFIEDIQIALRKIYEKETYDDTSVDIVDQREVNTT
jgi:hypothetical protein